MQSTEPSGPGPDRRPAGRTERLRAWLTRGRIAALALIAILIVGGAVWRWEAIGGDERVSTDEAGYADDANYIMAGKQYRTFKWAPGTPFVFAVAATLAGDKEIKIEDHAHGPAQDAQLALEILTLILIALTAWVLAGPWPAVGAVALAATYIPIIFITRTYLAEAMGGLMLVAVMLAALLAHRRLRRPGIPSRRRLAGDLLAVAATALIAGGTILSRNDLALGMVALGIALAVCGRPALRIGLARLGVFALVGVATITPWIIYASQTEGTFVPITTSGPDALFMGTYLPGGGEQFPVVKAFEKPVCAHLPKYCHPYEAGHAEPMFDLIEERHPNLSEPKAAQEEALHNLRVYGLGHPLSFLHMLWNKFWNMWRLPWSGGNSGLHPDTNHPQHAIYAALAWFGLLWGAFLRRRWPYLTVLAVLLVVSIFNVFFVAESRDNLRMMPLLFAYGVPGLWLAGGDIRRWIAARRGRAQPAGPSGEGPSGSGPGRARNPAMPLRT